MVVKHGDGMIQGGERACLHSNQEQEQEHASKRGANQDDGSEKQR